MAGDYFFDSVLVIDKATLTRSSGTGFLYDMPNGTVQAMYDSTGAPLGSLSATATGFTPQFRADISKGYLNFGDSYWYQAFSFQAMDGVGATLAAQQALVEALAAKDAAATAATSAQAAATAAGSVVGASWSSLAGKPAAVTNISAIGAQLMTAADQTAVQGIVGALSGTVTANSISDATATGRSLVKAVDGAAALSAIGAASAASAANKVDKVAGMKDTKTVYGTTSWPTPVRVTTDAGVAVIFIGPSTLADPPAVAAGSSAGMQPGDLRFVVG